MGSGQFAEGGDRDAGVGEAVDHVHIFLHEIGQHQYSVDAERTGVGEGAEHRFVSGRAGELLEPQIMFGGVSLKPGEHIGNHRVGIGGVGESERNLSRNSARGFQLVILFGVDAHAVVVAAGQGAVVEQIADDPADGVAAGLVMFGQFLFGGQVLFRAEAFRGEVAEEKFGEPAAFSVIVH